jgi:hypothetical protein
VEKLGGFALPLLLIAGGMIYSISEKVDKAKYAKQYEEEKAQIASMTADKTALQKYAQKLVTINELVQKNYTDKKESLKKIDTSLSKVMSLMITSRLSYADTTNKFNDSNTIIYHYNLNDLIQEENNELNEENLKDIWESFATSSSYANSTVIKWYKDGMVNNDIENVNPRDLESTNRIIDNKKYLVVMRLSGFTSPKIDNETIQKRANRSSSRNTLDAETPAFETGYLTANAYVYNIEEKKLMFIFKVFAHNSNSITTMSRSNDAQINVLENLHRDLLRNLYDETLYTLNIKERKEEN